MYYTYANTHQITHPTVLSSCYKEELSHYSIQSYPLNPIAPWKAKIVYNFGFSDCNTVDSAHIHLCKYIGTPDIFVSKWQLFHVKPVNFLFISVGGYLKLGPVLDFFVWCRVQFPASSCNMISIHLIGFVKFYGFLFFVL